MDTLSILIVEDDDAFSMSLRIYFKRLKYKCFFVRHDAQLFDVLESEEVSTVVLGSLKPISSIFDLIRKLKNDYSQLELIVMSEQNDLNYVIDLFRVGVSDYLIKPFAFPELKSSIERTEHFRSIQAS